MDDGAASDKGAVAGKISPAPAPLMLIDPVQGGKHPLRAIRRLQRRRARAARARRGGPWLFIALIVLGLVAVFGGLALTGKPIRLPVWAVAEAEARINAALRETVTGDRAEHGPAALSIGGAVIIVDRTDWVPRLLLEDVRLLQPGGEALVTLPEARLAFDPVALVRGQVRLRSLRIAGARVLLRRLADGRFDIRIGGNMPLPEFASIADALAAAEALFSRPSLSSLRRIEAEGLSLTLDDRQGDKVWQMGDGRLTFENRPDALALQVGVSLVGGGATPAQASLTLVTEKSSLAARMSVGVERVAAADIAVQAPALAWLGLVDAPISGQFSTAIDTAGRIGSLEARLDLGKGALKPGPGAAPVGFDHAGMFFTVDAAHERIDLGQLTVESPSLRMDASGHAYLPGLETGVPRTILAQFEVRQMRVDPKGLFDAPAEFGGGALDVRLTLDPFKVEVGQMTLLDGSHRMVAKGRAEATPKGWQVAMDVNLDEIDHRRLIALWPVSLVPRTREWLAENVEDGTLFDVRAALRLAPGQEPRLSLTYEYSGAGVRFMRSLPPVEGGYGYATVEGTRYTMVLDRGRVTMAQGGSINVAGSVFAVPDVTAQPSVGEISLRTEGSLTASLALLDLPPFGFLTKAGQPVDLGEGRASVRANLRVPLAQGAGTEAVKWQVEGRVTDFRSSKLVPGREVVAPVLQVTADPTLLTVAGPGTLDGVPFDATFTQPLGRDAGGAEVNGTVEVSRDTAERLRLGLPASLISGKGQADVKIGLKAGEPPSLRLTSDLQGVGLSIPELGWSKGQSGTGRLDVGARLGTPATIDRLRLDAAGLQAEGSVRLNPNGTLALARFDRVRVGGWLDAAVELRGQGASRSPAVALTGGSIDLRRLGGGTGGGSGNGTVEAALDRVTVSQGIALTGVRGTFSGRGGLNGTFTARVNGRGAVAGTVVPDRGGTSVRLVSDDAGEVLSAAGIFPNAQGGSLDMTLRPEKKGDGYAGDVKIGTVRVRNTPVLAELINAVSIVGLLEQMNGTGLLFNTVEARIRLTSDVVEVSSGSAVGASLGVSLAGIYELTSGRLRMQGVVSPIYLVNGIGAVLTRRGEGLFGFNYRITGTAENPNVSVNPLSILTPGMLREIFRNPAPTANAPRDSATQAPPPPPKDVYER